MQNRHITFKVAVGYVVLIVLLGMAVWGVYRMTTALAQLSETERSVSARRQAVERLVTSLLAASNSEQMLLAGVPDGEKGYLAALDTTLLAIDSLAYYLPDSLQRARLDTLSELLLLKCENSLRLSATLRDDGEASAYRRHIQDLQAGRDSVVVKSDVPQQEARKERTYIIKTTRRGFFRRLADAFRPSRADTTLVTEHAETLPADTVRRDVNVSDSVAKMLTDIDREVQRGKSARQQDLAVQRNRLWRTGADLTARMSRLIAGFRAEETGWLQDAIEAEQLNRRGEVWKMGAMAVAALLLSGFLFVLIWRDVTKARRYAREIEAAREQAENLMAQRERLLLTVAHDIKAPTASIAGYVEMLRPYVTEPAARLYMENIGGSATHLLHLVTSLLDYHRLENGSIALNPVAFVPAVLLRDVAESFRPRATEKQLTLDVQLTPEAAQTVRADAFRIRQMLDNLVGNALKFTQKGCITLRADLRDGQLRVAVSDTGPGMSVDDQQRIFDAFTRLPASQGIEGVGLGLSITRELALLLDGTLEVSSELGQGSTFSFAVPVTAANVEEVMSPSSDEGLAEADTQLPTQVRPLKILVIDDDRIALQLTVGMLRKVSAGQWQVTACQQVETLWEALAEQHFDILLTDIEMPALNGFQLVAQLRERYPVLAAMPVVALSAHGLLQEEDFRRAGFTAHLSKPFTAAQLAELVCRLTQAQTPENALQEAPLQEETAPPSAGGYTFNALTAFAEDDAAAAREIMQQFAADTRQHADDFAEAMAQSDKAEVCRLAHKMLPTLMLIQAPVIMQLERLDAERGQTEWTAADASDCRQIQEELGRILQALAKYGAGDHSQ